MKKETVTEVTEETVDPTPVEPTPDTPTEKTAPVLTVTEDEDKKRFSLDKIKNLFHRKDVDSEPDRAFANIEHFYAEADEGLSVEQVNKRIEQGLVNTTVKKYSKTYKSIFIGNICTFFNLLCVLCAIALLLAHARFGQFLFVPILLCNVSVGIFQEIRAKRKIDKLSILSSPSAKVVRAGAKLDIPVNELVVDDVILLTAGQQVPADCVVIGGSAELNESLLTGESVPIKKNVEDVMYAGSYLSSGQIAARVDKLGEHTYISKLTAKAKKYKRPNSEIMNSITLFIRIIGIMIVPLAILMLFNNLRNNPQIDMDNMTFLRFWKQLFSEGYAETGDLSNAIQKTVAVIIGMIPSGLLLLTTIALSVGIVRLAKCNTLVQDMYSLEMLARVNVLCLDKTGTITDGRMKVSDCILLNNTHGEGEEKLGIEDVIGSMLASLPDNNQTSIALYERFGHSAALQPISHLPFSSSRKLSAVTFQDAGTYVIGAPEFVLKPVPVRIDKIVKQYAQMGLRVLVLAHSQSGLQGEKLPSGLKAIAVITLSDNIRPDAIETIKWFRENDVNVKVISGDNPVTVSEVARRAGIANAANFISLEGLSDIDVENAANEYTVFGRVTPEQKAILIRAIKKAGNTVAMTGDGVNDILAMKEADCAISVASGSEAARNVSNLVLQDNNFGSMPHIVNEGRRVINNIKSCSSLYIMKTLLTLILAITCIGLRTEYFFQTNNMMLFEIFISAFPSLIMSLQPNTARVRGKFIPYVLSRALPGAITMAISVLALYVFSRTPLADEFGLLSQAVGADGLPLFLENGDPVMVTNSYYQALMMMALTFSGLVMLYRICQPFNLLRAVLFVIATGCCAAVLIVRPVCDAIIFEGWASLNFHLAQVLIMVILVQASVPISGFLIRAFDMMNPADETAEEKK